MKENKKKCRTCEVEKSLDEYYYNEKTNYYQYDCKKCCCEIAKKRLEENKKEINARRRNTWYNKKVAEILGIEYNARKKVIKEKKCNICEETKEILNFNKGSKKCKDCQSKYAKKWREDNRMHNLVQKRKHYKKNREEIRKRQKEYNDRAENKEKRNLKQREQRKDPVFKLNRNISGAIRKSLKGAKNGRSWEKIVGYTCEELKCHLEKMFDNHMTWDNYGKYWHLDHIIPQSLFCYKSEHDEEFKLCWSLNNLQPKEAKLNMSKGARYIG